MKRSGAPLAPLPAGTVTGMTDEEDADELLVVGWTSTPPPTSGLLLPEVSVAALGEVARLSITCGLLSVLDSGRPGWVL